MKQETESVRLYKKTKKKLKIMAAKQEVTIAEVVERLTIKEVKIL